MMIAIGEKIRILEFKVQVGFGMSSVLTSVRHTVTHNYQRIK